MDAHVLMMRIYERAAELRLLDPRKIVETEFANVPAEILDKTPKRENIYRSIRKIKRQKGYDIEDPASLTTINVDKLRKIETIGGEKMFFADTGLIEKTRSLIFTTPSLIDVYLQAKSLVCDATFDSKVAHFSQVWIVHAYIRDHVAVPVFVCLMSSKSERAYIEVLRRLPDHPSLEKYISDFERSEFNALAWKFSNAKHQGYLAHFARNLVEHFREAGYSKKEYKSNAFLRLSLKRMISLAFSDLNNVYQLFDEFKQNMERILPNDRNRLGAFFLYMTRTWTGYLDDQRNFHHPRYAYSHWILWDGTRYAPDRTMNVAEKWNEEFNKATGKNPTLCRFLEALHSEIAMIKKSIIEAASNATPLPTDKEILLAAHAHNYGILPFLKYFDRLTEIFTGIDSSYLSQ